MYVLVKYLVNISFPALEENQMTQMSLKPYILSGSRVFVSDCKTSAVYQEELQSVHSYLDSNDL